MSKCTVLPNGRNVSNILPKPLQRKMVASRFDLTMHFYVTSVNKN